jgi:hypothetical protein
MANNSSFFCFKQVENVWKRLELHIHKSLNFLHVTASEVQNILSNNVWWIDYSTNEKLTVVFSEQSWLLEGHQLLLLGLI